MKTKTIGFILMTLAAGLEVFHTGNASLTPAALAFVAGMYFGTLLPKDGE